MLIFSFSLNRGRSSSHRDQLDGRNQSILTRMRMAFSALLISTSPRTREPGIMLGAQYQALHQYGTRVVHLHVFNSCTPNRFLSGHVSDRKCRTHLLQLD